MWVKGATDGKEMSNCLSKASSLIVLYIYGNTHFGIAVRMAKTYAHMF